MNIKLTKHQADFVSWALDPMDDYFADLVRDGEIAAIPTLPVMEGNIFKWEPPYSDDVLRDLEYRLTEQAQDIAAEQGVTATAAIRAFEAIRDAVTNEGGPTL